MSDIGQGYRSHGHPHKVSPASCNLVSISEFGVNLNDDSFVVRELIVF